MVIMVAMIIMIAMIIMVAMIMVVMVDWKPILFAFQHTLAI